MQLVTFLKAPKQVCLAHVVNSFFDSLSQGKTKNKLGGIFLGAIQKVRTPNLHQLYTIPPPLYAFVHLRGTPSSIHIRRFKSLTPRQGRNHDFHFGGA